MARGRRVTAVLPEDLLHDAMKATGKSMNDTLVAGLRLLRRARAYQKAMALRGKIRLEVDREASRERSRR